jgi:AbrB family looped-hinge helix DNA binding protein
VKVSKRGQIVILKEVRNKFGIVRGRKLLVAVDNDEILLRRVEELSLRELSGRLSRHAKGRRSMLTPLSTRPSDGPENSI